MVLCLLSSQSSTMISFPSSQVCLSMLASLPLCLVGWCWSVGWGISLLNIASIWIWFLLKVYNQIQKSVKKRVRCILKSGFGHNRPIVQSQISSSPTRQRSAYDYNWSSKKSLCKEVFGENLKNLMWCLLSRGTPSSLQQMDLISIPGILHKSQMIKY